MNEKSKQNSDEIPHKLDKLSSYVFHLQKLTSDKKADTNGSKMDNPCCNFHHDNAYTFKEIKEWLSFLSAYCYGDTCGNGEDNQPQDVGPIGP